MAKELDHIYESVNQLETEKGNVETQLQESKQTLVSAKQGKYFTEISSNFLF